MDGHGADVEDGATESRWVIARDAECGNCHSPREKLGRASVAQRSGIDRMFVSCVECAWTGLVEMRRSDDPRELSSLEAATAPVAPEVSKAVEPETVARDFGPLIGLALTCEAAGLDPAEVLRNALAHGDTHAGAADAHRRSQVEILEASAARFEERDMYARMFEGHFVASTLRGMYRWAQMVKA